ncbi:N-acyl-D-amino-acid deacylase [Catalinimonas alkaloidigena]|uniref:N-acyl-D-amino-acid deacylase family protein n=1 Tax=Catalinimonas alkaloidigena TaxID=1075417 RepID=UPI00240737FE|nr:amidohydrolase family protein [Catalinimonas alkaloidigena]MDF9800319.1 N-acyl-D-amino-acid deacylase [Catalinimonas alkaloidigena]
MRNVYTIYLFLSILMISACTKKPSAFEKFVQKHQVGQYDLLIKNGQVIDGSGRDAYAADVLVKADSIAFVGQVDTAIISVTRFIDATGKVVTPGFIDTHAHGNPLETPAFRNFLAMGVTTISLGKDGSSPGLDSPRLDGPGQVGSGKEGMTAWMQEVEDTIPGVNIAMFVGHGTLRMLSGIKYNPRPTQEQIVDMGEMLAMNLDAGCFGMTTGLEYIPGTYAPDYELEYLAKIVGEKGKFITSHVRNEDDEAIESSLRELLLQGRYCPVQVSHMKVVYGKGERRAEEILRVLNEARAEGIEVTADVYPYTASYTTIGIVFPEWALPPNRYEEIVRSRRGELEEFLRNKVNQRNGPEATLLGTAPWAGKTLAQVAKELVKPFEDVLIDDIGPRGASGAYFVMNDELQARLIQDSLVMICSDGSPTSRHPRGHGTFAKIIEQYVVKDSLFSLEEAVRKMTSLPAKTMGVEDRGIIAKGKKADILVFAPAGIKATATYENPFQLAEGFNYVIVNGQLSLVESTFSDKRHGKMLRKN